MRTDRYVGRTLHEVMGENFMVARGFAGVSIFVKNPSDPSTAPGRKYAEGLNLGAILRTHDELNAARVVGHNTYCGSNVFRVTMP